MNKVIIIMKGCAHSMQRHVRYIISPQKNDKSEWLQDIFPYWEWRWQIKNATCCIIPTILFS